MKYTIQALTPFKGSGTEADPNRPALADEHPVLGWTDVTGIPGAEITPDPNLYVIEATVDETMLAAIEADNKYRVLSVDEVTDAPAG